MTDDNFSKSYKVIVSGHFYRGNISEYPYPNNSFKMYYISTLTGNVFDNFRYFISFVFQKLPYAPFHNVDTEALRG